MRLTPWWSFALVRLALLSAFALAFGPVTLLAQRQLSWDALDVTASLGGNGTLDVVETHTMVFTGDWNGGERTFNLRPRQRLTIVGMERIDPATGQRTRLNRDSSLDDVDDYALSEGRRLRWRSRLPSDPSFANTRIVYAIHYRLAGILLKDAEQYLLDHDFAFPDRDGNIARFSLALAFDAGWKPLPEVKSSYAAGPIAPGQGFVLKIPLRYEGTGSPAAIDTRRPWQVVAGVSVIVAALVLSIAGLLRRERQLGRLEPVRTTGIDANWIREHIVAHPPEVIGAAWDGSVGKDEVSALIARLVAEGRVTSQVSGTSLSLTLHAARSTFEGYERALVDKLFFGNRNTTSTDDIKSHYAKKGFDPAGIIQKDLLATVAQLVPSGEKPRIRWQWSLVLFLVGAGCLIWDGATNESGDPRAPLIVGLIAMLAAALGQIPGSVFRNRVHWGYKALAFSLVAPVAVASLAAWYLWYRVGTAAVDWSPWTIAGLTIMTCWVVSTMVNAHRSRLDRGTIAFRRMLAAGRLFFRQELANERPALSDAWFPWVVAFGLTRDADRWSVRHQSDAESSSHSSRADSSSWSGSSSSEPSWTGAAGGRSGGAGGGATWAAAVGGMAAGVAAPSSGGSSGSGGSSSGGSSSGGSSGGGGGGGW